MKKELEILIEKGKKDIKEFMRDNPELLVNNLSDLHNYFDANCYVETLFNEDGDFMLYEANLVNNALDNFIKINNK
tara:strand:+ start:507 stop:734 length:228 start_codon:yes stop_codon:yes gene_type:complete